MPSVIGASAYWRRPNKNKSGHRVTRVTVIGTMPSGYYAVEWIRRHRRVYEIVPAKHIILVGV